MSDKPRFQNKALADLDASFNKPSNPPPAQPPANPNPPPPPPKVEPPAPTPPVTPAPPAPQQADDTKLLEDLLDGKEPAPPAPKPGETPPPTPAAEPPKDSVGLRNLRAAHDALKAEHEKLKEGNKPLLDEINALRTKLAAYDVQEDPNFRQKYDTPVMQARQKLLAAARSAGIDPAKAESLLSQPLTAAAQVLADVPTAVQNLLLGIHTEHAQHLHARQDALAAAPTLAQQLAEQRKQQAQQQQEEAIRLRNSVMRSSILEAGKANPLLRPNPNDPEHTKAVQQAILATKQIVEGEGTQAPSDAAAVQISLIYKGVMFDSMAARLKAAEERADRILTAAKARGLLADEPLSSGAPAAKADDDDKNISAEEALRRGYFKPGGKYDMIGQDRR